jgi:hypothetical protein
MIRAISHYDHRHKDHNAVDISLRRRAEAFIGFEPLRSDHSAVDTSTGTVQSLRYVMNRTT